MVPDLTGSSLMYSFFFFLWSHVSNEQKQVWDILRERCSLDKKISWKCSGLNEHRSQWELYKYTGAETLPEIRMDPPIVHQTCVSFFAR